MWVPCWCFFLFGVGRQTGRCGFILLGRLIFVLWHFDRLIRLAFVFFNNVVFGRGVMVEERPCGVVGRGFVLVAWLF